ncbi:MAG: hypothetical protein JSV88_12250, partial [Candidatus Aminicenantes bacterium]
RNRWFLDISLDNLTLGRAWMMQAEKEGTRDFHRAAAYLDRAVEGLRESGNQDDLPRGLLARAACSRLQGLFSRAHQDLQEAKEIAEQGEMKLHLIDYHLETARLCLAQNNPLQAKDHFNTAADMIKKTGYHRRDPEMMNDE